MQHFGKKKKHITFHLAVNAIQEKQKIGDINIILICVYMLFIDINSIVWDL